MPSRNRLLASLLCSAALGSGAAFAQGVEMVADGSQARVVAADLASPWEVTYGADDHLWVTERKAARIARIDPASAAGAR